MLKNGLYQVRIDQFLYVGKAFEAFRLTKAVNLAQAARFKLYRETAVVLKDCYLKRRVGDSADYPHFAMVDFFKGENSFSPAKDSYDQDKGAGELRGLWTDPAFEAGMNAAYYVRVLENPTCRWSTWQANAAGVERHPDRPATLQERAYSSPIWYNAK